MRHTLYRAAAAAALFLLCVLAALAQVPAGYVQVTGALTTDSSGAKVANGTIAFAPVNNTGQAIGYQVNGAGHAITSPVTTLVTNGAFSIQLADTTLTTPVNVCFSVTVTDNTSGKSYLGPGYTCFQPAGYGTAVSSGMCTAATGTVGGTCNFDKFQPNLPGLVVQQTGPTGPQGPIGPQGPPGGALSYPGVTSDGANGLAITGKVTASQHCIGTSCLSVWPSGSPGSVIGDGTTYTTIAAAQTEACSHNPAYKVVIPPTSGIALSSTLDALSSRDECPAGTTAAGQPIAMVDQRLGEEYGNFSNVYAMSNSRMILRQVKAKIAKMETLATGNLTIGIYGDSTGNFTTNAMFQRLVARYDVAGVYSNSNAGRWGGLLGWGLYPATPGVTSNFLGLNSGTVGDCGLNTTKDYTISPFGFSMTLGLATPTAQCTLTESIGTQSSAAMPIDSLTVVYKTEPGAGTLTVSVGDGIGPYIQVASVSAAGSVGAGVINLGPAQIGAKFTRFTITNGTTGQVRLLSVGARDSTKSGVIVELMSAGGTGIGGLLTNTAINTVVSSIPGPDWATSQWKNNDALTSAQYKSYLQQFYSMIQPYGFGYNVSTSPNPVDVTYFGSYVDNSMGALPVRDFNSAARQIAESNPNAYYFDESFSFTTYNDAIAMGLNADTIHLNAQGVRFFSDRAWAELGLEPTSTFDVKVRTQTASGSATAPAKSWIDNPNIGSYFDGTNENHVGPWIQRGAVFIQRGNSPAAPTVTPLVPGSTTYTYVACGLDGTNSRVCSPATTIATGNASLAAGPNVVTIAANPGFNTCSVFRTAGGATQGGIQGSYGCSGQSYVLIDNGIVASTAQPPNDPAPFGINCTPSQAFPFCFSFSPNPATPTSPFLRMAPGAGNTMKEFFCPSTDTNGTTCSTMEGAGSFTFNLVSNNVYKFNVGGAQVFWIGTTGGATNGITWGQTTTPIVGTDTRYILDSGKVPIMMGTLTTTAAASDAIPGAAFTLKTGQLIGRITATSNCFVQPNNGTAAGSVWFSAYAAGSVTVNHAATAGMGYDVWCAAD